LINDVIKIVVEQFKIAKRPELTVVEEIFTIVFCMAAALFAVQILKYFTACSALKNA